MFRSLKNHWRSKRWGLVSRQLKEGTYVVEIDGVSKELAHSTFNTNWLDELGIGAKVVLDLGSYDGGDGLRFAKTYKDCRIISVEADPDRFKVVEKVLKNSGAELFQAAICTEDGPIDWYSGSIEGAAHAQGSLFRQSQKYKEKFPFVEQAAQPELVEGTRLDTLCAKLGIENVDLLHMDIEGSENLALRSLGELRPKAIFLEMRDKMFVNAPSSIDTDKLLRGLGYQLILHLGIDRLYFYMDS